ncbi:uncharacterized protein LOC144135006 [Amblyomma americanum]
MCLRSRAEIVLLSVVCGAWNLNGVYHAFTSPNAASYQESIADLATKHQKPPLPGRVVMLVLVVEGTLGLCVSVLLITACLAERMDILQATLQLCKSRILLNVVILLALVIRILTGHYDLPGDTFDRMDYPMGGYLGDLGRRIIYQLMGESPFPPRRQIKMDHYVASVFWGSWLILDVYVVLRLESYRNRHKN